MGNQAATQRSIGTAVFIINREILFKNLFGVTNSTVNTGCAHTHTMRGGGHNTSPERSSLIIGCVPHHKSICMHLIQHLGAEGHLTGDLDIRRTFDGKGYSSYNITLTQRTHISRQSLIQQTELPQNITNSTSIELFIAFQ